MIDSITNVASKIVGVLRTAIEVLEMAIVYLRKGVQIIETNLEQLGK